MAVTNGRESLAELYDLVGGERRESTFSSENGAEVLRPHFARVERHDVDVRAVFADRTAAAAYLETLERGELRRPVAGRHGPAGRARGGRRVRSGGAGLTSTRPPGQLTYAANANWQR